MTDILITGNAGLLGDGLPEELAEDFRVVLAGKGYMAHKGKGVRTYRIAPSEKAFGQIFDVYSFKAVIFVSGYIDGGDGAYGEIKDLERVLLHAVQNGVNKVVVLSSIESLNYVPSIGAKGIELDRNYYRSVSLRANQIEELCRFFSETTKLKTVTLRLPYVADQFNDSNFLGSVFKQARGKEKVLLPYREEDRIDFISMEDLTDLLRRVVQEEGDRSQAHFVCSGYRHTYGDLAAVLKSREPDLEILYENLADVITWKDYPKELRRIYGWIPKDDVVEQTGYLYEKYCSHTGISRRTLREWFEKLLSREEGLFKYAELLLVFAGSEWLNSVLSVTVYFRFVDVRLFFVVIMGTIYGIRLGIMAAVLECLALLYQYLHMGVDWTLLFYNVENWIPFMIYLMAGSVTGYVRNKKTEEIRFSKDEYRLLRDKYIFLNEVYQGAIENKGEYKKQILGFKDSFGRIFDAVQKLDNILPQSIFLEALLIMEDILDNHSIAIYSVDEYQRFGRLVVCSNLLRSRLPKSMVLEESAEMFEAVKENRVYKNTRMREGMPVYANGVFRDGKLVLFVVIYEASAEQYGMNYMNLFRILCGLVQTSFLRALDYDELAEEKIYYPGTNVMRRERFAEILRVQQEMQEKEIADHVLVRIEETDRTKVSDMLSRIVRAADIIGEGEDGKLYLLLTQVNQDSFRFVEARLLKTGLFYEVVGRQ